VSAKEVYKVRDLANHHGGVVRVGDSVYGTNNSELLCIDFKTGETRWRDRSVGKGSVAAADGCLYVRGERGAVALVEATPSGYRERGRFDQPDRSGKNAWPHPVIAGGRLYLRDWDVLLCYDVKGR
jgi:outer membrane protein assembly factor BamB